MAFPLRNGVALPAIGLGTYKATGENVKRAVQWALEAGIGHIDTALGYKVTAWHSMAWRDFWMC